jgi:hypothetical protein
MNDDDLDRINLHAWRVPPAAAPDRAAILARSLSPAAPPKRSRTMWMFAALAIANVVLAAIIVIILAQPSRSTVVYQPAGGAADAATGELLRRLEHEQRELERKLVDIQRLRTVVENLSERVRDCEQHKADRTLPKPRRSAPDPVATEPCDEVSCVLTNYDGACCTKFRRGRPAPTAANVNPNVDTLPETLDRLAITTAIAAIRTKIVACGHGSKGKVKVKVRVSASGAVVNVIVESTPEPELGFCVARVVETAKFAPTQYGGSFSYPFVF